MRLEVGKLPNELLSQLLAKVGHRDPRVLVEPKVGEDAAVIDMGQRLLVAKSDPITFASDLIGWYAVHINANDVACMGAKPCWFLATILLPQGASEELAGNIFDQILDACQAMEIELVGGHTEITYRLERPIVVGAMLGEVERDRLVTGSGARPGDALILPKGIAIGIVLCRVMKFGTNVTSISKPIAIAIVLLWVLPGNAVVAGIRDAVAILV